MWVAYKKTLFTKWGLSVSRVGIDQLISVLASTACVNQGVLTDLLSCTLIAVSKCINIAFRSPVLAGPPVWTILPTTLLAAFISRRIFSTRQQVL